MQDAAESPSEKTRLRRLLACSSVLQLPLPTSLTTTVFFLLGKRPHASPQVGIYSLWSRIPQTLRIDNFVETLSRDDSLRRWGQRPNEEIHSDKCSGRDGDVRNRPCVLRTSLDKLDAQGLDPAHLCQGELVACTGHQLPSCLPC